VSSVEAIDVPWIAHGARVRPGLEPCGAPRLVKCHNASAQPQDLVAHHLRTKYTTSGKQQAKWTSCAVDWQVKLYRSKHRLAKRAHHVLNLSRSLSSSSSGTALPEDLLFTKKMCVRRGSVDVCFMRP
jgi:hypothetical protein